jgi:uncharacterized membrane protein
VTRTRASRRPWRASAALLAGAGALLSGCARGDGGGPQARAASYQQARAVIARHCLGCHSEWPTVPAFPIAPDGFSFDTAEQMRRHAARIKQRTVVDRTMPLLNKTGMTDAERELLGSWVDAGARTP